MLQIVLAHQHDILHQRAHHLARQYAGGLDGDAFGDRIAVAIRPPRPCSAADHRRIALGLHADDLDARRQRLGRHGDAGNQAAAADRHHQHLQLRHRRQHLQRDGALTRHHRRIIVGMHEHQLARQP